jgi:anti-sigma regulatory factor (Ser/Thr protein kinase)
MAEHEGTVDDVRPTGTTAGAVDLVALAPEGLDLDPAPLAEDEAPPAVGADRSHSRTRRLDDGDVREAPRLARALVLDACAAWELDDDITDVLMLLTSELVTNAARHAPPPLLVTVAKGTSGVLVTCTDSSAAPPRQQRPDLEDDGGRGVYLIEMLASSWGYEITDEASGSGQPGGKRVWFVVDHPPQRREPLAGPPAH